MKFIDSKGKVHSTYLKAVGCSIINLITPMKKKPEMVITGPDDDGWEPQENIHDEPVSEEPVYPMDQVFEPGVTPKIPMDKKKHTARIDFENHQIFLEDEEGNIVTSTRFDSRLDNCPTKDLFNMIFDEVQSTSHIDPPANC